MSFLLQIVIVFSSIFLLACVLHLVKCRKLQLRYSLLWLALATVVLLCSLFPFQLFEVAMMLGFETPSNFIFFCAALFMIAITLSLSSIISKQSIAIKNLTQKIALLEHSVCRDESMLRASGRSEE